MPRLLSVQSKSWRPSLTIVLIKGECYSFYLGFFGSPISFIKISVLSQIIGKSKTYKNGKSCENWKFKASLKADRLPYKKVQIFMVFPELFNGVVIFFVTYFNNKSKWPKHATCTRGNHLWPLTKLNTWLNSIANLSDDLMAQIHSKFSHTTIGFSAFPKSYFEV